MGNLVNQNAEHQHSLAAQRERDEHREWIGGRVLVLLSHYWRDDDPVTLTAALGKDWADVLEGLPQDAIQKACIQYQRSAGRGKPTPNAIYKLAKPYVPRPEIAQPPPERARALPSAERRAEILKEAGFKPKGFPKIGEGE